LIRRPSKKYLKTLRKLDLRLRIGFHKLESL
jgi:hypothetical protein